MIIAEMTNIWNIRLLRTTDRYKQKDYLHSTLCRICVQLQAGLVANVMARDVDDDKYTKLRLIDGGEDERRA